MATAKGSAPAKPKRNPTDITAPPTNQVAAVRAARGPERGGGGKPKPQARPAGQGPRRRSEEEVIGVRDLEVGPLRVTATRLCLYGEMRRREGDVFILRDKKHFNPRCMAWVPSETPVKRTTGRQVLEQQHADTLQQRAATAGLGAPGQTGETNGRDPGGNVDNIAGE